MRTTALAILVAVARAARPERSMLFSSSPPAEKFPECSETPPDFPVPDVASKNEIFDQLTVAEQLSIEEMMKPFGVAFDAWSKCVTVNCSTIAKLQLVKPPKAQVLSYFAGGPKPKRVAQFWWLRANLRPRVAELHTVELPIGPTTMPVLVRSVPWEQRPFVSWEDTPLNQRNSILEPMRPIFDDLLKTIIPSETTKAKLEAAGEEWAPYVRFGGGATSVPGSTPERREYLGRVDIRVGVGVSYFKEGPVQYTMSYDWETDTLTVYDIVFCPGMGNPLFPTVDSVLEAYNAGTLKMCEIDGEFYGDTTATMDPEPPYFIPEEVASRSEPRIYYPEGPRFAIKGRTVSWMGWDVHADINGITGMHLTNLRFQGERIAYEIHATDFTAVYSGASTRKDIFYSDGGYEMGNCATTLRVGLQCPEQSVFLYGLGYDSSYVWGNALSMDAVKPTMCIFEAPENGALFQHARAMYEGLPKSSLYIRSVLTVGNYDYTQTFKLDQDGSFDFYKQLSGYAVGAYVLPTDASTEKLQDIFGALVSKSSLGALHTHSAGYKIDLDIGGLANSFKYKKPGYGPLSELLESTGMDTTGVTAASTNTYYYTNEYVTSEGMWDNDGDDTWTPPAACLRASTDEKFIVVSEESKTNLGHKRGYIVHIPTSAPQMLPEHDKYLHLQNFTKCDIAATKYSTSDAAAVSMEVFGNLYPIPASDGNDLSHFFNDESLEGVDIVLYAHNTKHHYVKTEDVPVPSNMGGALSFEPFNYFVDDVSPIKHLNPSLYRYSTPDRDAIPPTRCAA